jgi:hypothetical protein
VDTVGDELDLIVLIGGTEEHAVIQLKMSMWFRERGEKFVEGHMIRKRCVQRSFGDHVNQKRIFSDWVRE